MPPPDPETDRWLSQFVQPHEAMLRAWLQSRFPQLADVDDIVQEAYARVLAARSRTEVRQPKAFFFATARNLALDYFRRRQIARVEPLGEIDELCVLEDGDNVAETVARNQEIELMTQAIQSLPDRCRQVMTLRHVYGLSQKAVAAELGISVRTVEAQVTIGIKRCTQFVRRRCPS
ncbi:MAG: sigma-70 family RNA polymerase sigma factor [Opitutaceae bacterium]|nr:sigma-70 family RNA polymerase sigma factor [Opitutaceae bacterium]